MPVGISIQEINPSDFASLCWELHPTQRNSFSDYFEKNIRENRGILLAAYDRAGVCCGRIAVEIHPGYLSRGRPCITFGWLDGNDSQVVKELLNFAVEWAIAKRINEGGKVRHSTLLRGPISFPKGLGGVGCEVEGFDRPRMYGVSTNRRALCAWIASAGFTPDASYADVEDLNQSIWKSGEDDLSRAFQLVYFSMTEWEARKEELVSLIDAAFANFLPDTIGGRFTEAITTLSAHPNGKLFWPAALDKDGRLAGLIACFPNLWELWEQKPLTSLNVDTTIIHPEYRRHGIFSLLHNKGIFNVKKYCNIRKFEATGIWFANKNAVEAFFPHCPIVRRHTVFQKRVKNRS